MTEHTLDEAILQARRFLRQAQLLRHQLRHSPVGLRPGRGTPHTAAVRRASMDLTRSLADLRRPNSSP